uniref:Uncharacterized protein n=1 Tax=Lotharella globosa TaxID=91324 RepID=A0A7S3YXX8_9EUKA
MRSTTTIHSENSCARRNVECWDHFRFFPKNESLNENSINRDNFGILVWETHKSEGLCTMRIFDPERTARVRQNRCMRTVLIILAVLSIILAIVLAFSLTS